MRIDHIQLAMPPGNEEVAREFFAGILGMQETEKPFPLSERGGVWFVKDEAVVHVGVEKEFRPQKKAHPAFLVREIDTLAARLKDAGCVVAWDEALPDRRRFYSADPFGNRLEFITDGHGFTQM